MGMDGISQELQTVDGEDQRFNKRFAEVPGALSQYPHVSIPAACGGHAATMAAYRFFENPKTNLENILQPHRHATQERLAAQDVVLCVQDTTELDLTRPQQQIRGLGPVGKGSTRRGAYLHLLTAFTPDGTPLGTPGHKYIVQEDKTPEEKTPEEKTLKKIVQKHHPGQRKVIVGVDTLEEVLRVIEYYECRWMIEIFFKTLKSGCKVESLQFEETSRLEPCLGMYLIVAWRVLFVVVLAAVIPTGVVTFCLTNRNENRLIE